MKNNIFKYSLLNYISVTLVVSVAVVFLGVSFQGKTSALSGSEFDAGYIIDDSVFYDSGAMSLQQIQQFLDSKVPVCDTNGTQPIYGTTRAAYGASQGHPAPYTCLKNYTQNTTAKSPESYLCNGHTAGLKSAAQIIHEVAISCGINPQTLIVLLQKEQSLITDEWPWTTQYRSATGYGCPDTAPCDAEYYGFFNQVYEAARAFKRYALNSQNYNYRANRNNFIYYHPSLGACGGTNVFIQNQATANLYIYTPYQPNSSALANLYGSGDSCGAYGNRNFWRMFNDWFGSTRGSYLLRSAENATVYVVSGDNKYPIADMNVMNALSPLGPVKFVSQSYLDSKQTGVYARRLLRAENGTIFFHDAGIKLPFTSCATVSHYGYTCGDYIDFTDAMLQKFVTGPYMTRSFGTTNGKSFYIDSGTKKEVFDQTSKTLAGINENANVLNESAINNLAYGSPIIRDGVLVYKRGFTDIYLHQQNQLNPLSGSIYFQTGLQKNLPKSTLDTQSINQLTQGGYLNGFVRNIAGTLYYVLDSNGKAQISTPAQWTGSFTSLSDTTLNLINNSAQPVNNGLIKSPNNGTIYLVDNGKKRPFHDWSDLTRMKISPLTINTVSDVSVGSITNGVRILGPGSMVKYPNNGTVYIVEDTSNLLPISTFAVPVNLGLGSSVSTVSDSILDTYIKKVTPLGVLISCNGKNYVGSNGKLYEVTNALQPHFGFVYTSVAPILCENLDTTKTVSRFLLGSNGTIYYVEDGFKRPISSFPTYIQLGGNSTNTISFSDLSLSMLQTGTTL